jgi:hypothetical protein
MRLPPHGCFDVGDPHVRHALDSLPAWWATGWARMGQGYASVELARGRNALSYLNSQQLHDLTLLVTRCDWWPPSVRLQSKFSASPMLQYLWDAGPCNSIVNSSFKALFLLAKSPFGSCLACVIAATATGVIRRP